MLSSLALPPWVAGCRPLGRQIHLQLGLCHWSGTQAGRLCWDPPIHSAPPGRQPTGLRQGAGGLPVG